VQQGDDAHQHPATDWTVVGSDLLLLGWFGFLYLLLYLLAFSATMPLKGA
jgi:hypothetical protein